MVRERKRHQKKAGHINFQHLRDSEGSTSRVSSCQRQCPAPRPTRDPAYMPSTCLARTVPSASALPQEQPQWDARHRQDDATQSQDSPGGASLFSTGRTIAKIKIDQKGSNYEYISNTNTEQITIDTSPAAIFSIRFALLFVVVRWQRSQLSSCGMTPRGSPPLFPSQSYWQAAFMTILLTSLRMLTTHRK